MRVDAPARVLPKAAPLGAVALLLGALVHAEPYLPQHDGEVVEQLPRVLVGATAQLRRLREQAAVSADLPSALALARHSVELGRREADPRYNGYAEAALKTWWTLPDPPVEVRILRAVLRQARHEFDAALADLEGVLDVAPRHAQAWLTRAMILQVRGDYSEARRSCAVLATLAGRLVAATCLASIAGPQSRAAYRLLAHVLEASPVADVDVRRWALTVLAELAVRLGHTADAERYFQMALAMSPDVRLLAAYADFLLNQGRFEAVREQLRDHARADGLLLRLALAERRSGSPALDGRVAELTARFAAARRRGDSVHLREEARAALHLLDDPDQALDLALRNWAVQREPADARAVLEAALAADPAAARPVLAWLAQSGLQDVRVAALVRRFEGSAP